MEKEIKVTFRLRVERRPSNLRDPAAKPSARDRGDDYGYSRFSPNTTTQGITRKVAKIPEFLW